MITLWIPGVPRATQTGSVARVQRPGRKDRLVPMRRGTSWARTCKAEAIRQYRGKPLEGALEVSVAFSFDRPATVTREHPTVRPDIDGLVKGLLDAWNGVLWKDDAQVVKLTLTKEYDIHPGVLVAVEPAP